MYGKGISREGDVLDCAVEAKIIEKAGSWYSFDGNRIGQGRENVKNYLIQNNEILDKVQSLLLDQLKKIDDIQNEEELKVDEDGVVIED